MNTISHNVYATNKAGKTYYVVTYQHNGRRKIKYAPAKYQSEAEVNNWFTTEFLPTQIPAIEQPAINSKTIAGLADWWFDYRKNDPEIHNRKGYINNWILGKGRDGGSKKAGDLPALPHPLSMMDLEVLPNPNQDTAITQANDDKFTLCSDWIASINRSPATVRNIVQTARVFIDDCRKKGKISRTNSINYFRDKTVLSTINDGKPVTRVIGDENTITLKETDVAAMLSCSTIPIERLIRYWLAFSTGLRDSELAGLQWQDISFTNNTITVDRQLNRASKGPIGIAQFKAPKKASFRTLPLHSSALHVLKVWKESGWLAYVGQSPSESDPVLPNHRGYFYHPHSSVFMRKDLKRAGLSDMFRGVGGTTARYDFHSTRRTFASMCSDAGIDGHKLAALMGHKAKGVTAKHYLGKNLEAVRQAIETLPLKGLRST